MATGDGGRSQQQCPTAWPDVITSGHAVGHCCCPASSYWKSRRRPELCLTMNRPDIEWSFCGSWCQDCWSASLRLEVLSGSCRLYGLCRLNWIINSQTLRTFLGGFSTLWPFITTMCLQNALNLTSCSFDKHERILIIFDKQHQNSEHFQKMMYFLCSFTFS